MQRFAPLPLPLGPLPLPLLNPRNIFGIPPHVNTHLRNTTSNPASLNNSHSKIHSSITPHYSSYLPIQHSKQNPYSLFRIPNPYFPSHGHLQVPPYHSFPSVSCTQHPSHGHSQCTQKNPCAMFLVDSPRSQRSCTNDTSDTKRHRLKVSIPLAQAPTD